jgi:hypothetical protein
MCDWHVRVCAGWRIMPVDCQSEWARGGGQVPVQLRRRGAADADTESEFAGCGQWMLQPSCMSMVNVFMFECVHGCKRCESHECKGTCCMLLRYGNFGNGITFVHIYVSMFVHIYAWS